MQLAQAWTCLESVLEVCRWQMPSSLTTMSEFWLVLCRCSGGPIEMQPHSNAKAQHFFVPPHQIVKKGTASEP